MVDSGTTDGGTISLGSQVGEMLSGFTPSEPAPEADASAAEPSAPSTEPAAPAESAEPTAEPSETPAETDPASAEPAAPDATAASKEPEPDPLKDAKALTYTVDGQTRTYDGIKVLGDDGAIVDAAALPDLMRRLGERDHLVTANQQLFRDHDTLTKLTAWTTQGADGKEQTTTGPEAIVESRASAASDKASLQVLAQALLDPVKFARLVAVDDKNQVILNPEAREALETQMELASDRAAGKIRAELAQQIVRAAAPVASEPDYATEGPRLIGEVAAQFKLDATKLTPADRAALLELLPNFVKDGKVHPTWQKEVKRAIERSAQVASIATTATDAAKQNAARLVAAAKRPAKPAAPAAPAKPVPAATQRAQDSGDVWDRMERAAAKAVAGAR